MKSKFTKAILISILVSVGIIALLSVALLFWLFPSGIVTRASLYSFLISFIPVIAAGIVLAISLLWIESANYSLNKVAADYDPDAINPSGYDSPLYNSVNEEKDYDSAFLKGAPIPEDWERIEEYDPLNEKQKNRINAKTAKYEKDGEQTFADAYPDLFKEDEGENVFAFIPPEENKELQPFGAYEFDLPEVKKPELSAAKGSVNFIWNKDTAQRFDGELYISPSPEQIMRGEFVKKLRPTVYVEPDVIMTGAYNLTPEECTEFESEAVVYSYEDNSLSEQYAAMKHSEKVESPVFEDEQKTEEARRVDVYNGNLFVAPIELSPSSKSANASYAYLTHPYENKEPITRAEGCVDFTWNRDTAKRFEGELYISPSPDQIERGEFVKKLRPTTAAAIVMSGEYNLNPEESTEFESDAVVYSYEEDHSLSEQYAKMKHSEEVESPVFEEESTAEAKEQSEVQKCKYCPNGQAIDGADHDSAYSTLMLTSASKNITEEAYQKLWLLEDVVINQTEEDVQASAKEEESNVYSGNLFVSPIEMSPSSESANESYSYLTHPYGNPAYADYSARKLPPFTEFEFDLPKKKEPITRAEGCVEFTWNKDTAVRGEGERYIEPTEEMKKRGEFVAHLSPVKAPEKIDTVSPAYEALSLPQNVSEGFEEETTAEVKEQSEVQKCKYCPNGQAIDGADHDSAYSTLMLTSASKNITEEAYQKLWLLEDVVINQTEEDVEASSKEEESDVYNGDLFVSPIEMIPSSESANESYSYLTHPYGNPAYADYSARKLPPFTEFEFDLPKKKEPITRAEGCVEFTWNKDTAVRGEGEKYIEPTEEMKKRGEFVAHLSPVKAPEKIDTVGPAYEELSLPQNVSEGEEDKESSAALLDTDGTENIVKYVADSAVDANADTNDAYYSLMGMAGKTKPAEPISFSQEFTSILQLEMNSALSLGYELTIARITSNYVDSIMALDFEALAFKESDDRACIIFQCQTKAEAGELVSMIKEAIGDKSLKVKMAELKGRNITPDAFSKEIMK